MVVVGERQVPPMVPFVAVVVVAGGTWWVVVVVIAIVRGMIIHILLILLLLGLLSKAMFNRVQNLHLSGVLLPY